MLTCKRSQNNDVHIIYAYMVMEVSNELVRSVLVNECKYKINCSENYQLRQPQQIHAYEGSTMQHAIYN